MTADKLDPAVCRELAAWSTKSADSLFFPENKVYDEKLTAIATQLLAAADLAESNAAHSDKLEAMARLATEQRDVARTQLAERQTLTADEVRGEAIRAVDACMTAGVVARNRIADRLAERPAGRVAVAPQPVQTVGIGLSAEECSILMRLRDNEARARNSIGHLGTDVRQQCDSAVTLLDRLLAAPRSAPVKTVGIGPEATKIILDALDWFRMTVPIAPHDDIAQIRDLLTGTATS